MNWIFAGTGWMAQQMLSSLKQIEGQHISAAISRRSQHLKEFCEKNEIPNSYTHPSEISRETLKNLNIESIYISTPHSSHEEWVEWGLKNHLNVLVEKPACLSSARWKELSALAHQKEKCLMEARWTLFFPAIQFLRNEFQDGNLGQLKRIDSKFCIEKPYDPEHRLYNKELGGGALWDLGIYNLTLIQLFYSKDEIELVKVEKKLCETGVDQHLKVTYKLPHEGEADFECAIDRNHPQDAHLEFSLANANLKNFFHPTEIFWQNGFAKKQQSFETYNQGYQHELLAFIEGCKNNEVEIGLCNHQWTLEVLEMIEEILAFERQA